LAYFGRESHKANVITLSRGVKIVAICMRQRHRRYDTVNQGSTVRSAIRKNKLQKGKEKVRRDVCTKGPGKSA